MDDDRKAETPNEPLAPGEMMPGDLHLVLCMWTRTTECEKTFDYGFAIRACGRGPGGVYHFPRTATLEDVYERLKAERSLGFRLVGEPPTQKGS